MKNYISVLVHVIVIAILLARKQKVLSAKAKFPRAFSNRDRWGGVHTDSY